MEPRNRRWKVRLAAEFGHADITPELEKLVSQSGIRNGMLSVQMLGSNDPWSLALLRMTESR